MICLLVSRADIVPHHLFYLSTSHLTLTSVHVYPVGIDHRVYPRVYHLCLDLDIAHQIYDRPSDQGVYSTESILSIPAYTDIIKKWYLTVLFTNLSLSSLHESRGRSYRSSYRSLSSNKKPSM